MTDKGSIHEIRIWSILLIVKGGCCSISDDLSSPSIRFQNDVSILEEVCLLMFCVYLRNLFIKQSDNIFIRQTCEMIGLHLLALVNIIFQSCPKHPVLNFS